MAAEQSSGTLRRQRRFARLPHDTSTLRIAQEWAADVTSLQACELLIPEIERGAFLAHGRYKERCYATLTREEEKPTGFCDAVSGWGATPASALVDLAFQWVILCRQSWYMATHARLVSDVVL